RGRGRPRAQPGLDAGDGEGRDDPRPRVRDPRLRRSECGVRPLPRRLLPALAHTRIPAAMPENDPRVFFAAERTLLAWVRTGLGLIGMGFVVARFGLFLQLFSKESGSEVSHHVSPWVGVSLALLGSAASG